MSELFAVTATTPGGLPLEIRFTPDGFETSPPYLIDWLQERAQRDRVIAGSPAGPVAQPTADLVDLSIPAAMYLAVDVLLSLDATGIDMVSEVGDVWDPGELLDIDLDDLDDLDDPDDQDGSGEVQGRHLRLINPDPDPDPPEAS